MGVEKIPEYQGDMIDRESRDDILLIGLSHKTASIEVREKFTCLEKDQDYLLEQIVGETIHGAVILSTCNRFELYLACDDPHGSAERVFQVLENYFKIPECEFRPYFYKEYSRDGILHLLNVTSSIDSMVIGENEIVSQVKKAYSRSNQKGYTGPLLNRLFHQAFRTAKKVKTETAISQNPISVAYIAIEMARRVFKTFKDKTVLMIGAGEMGELILKYLTGEDINRVIIANRSLQNARRVAEKVNNQAHVIPLEDMMDVMTEVDIIISTAASDNYLLDRKNLEELSERRSGKPLFLVDIAVPRNIEPNIRGLDNLLLYNIDDLKEVAAENLKTRYDEVEIARRIIEDDTEKFLNWYDEQEVVPIIMELQDEFDFIRKSELEKYRGRKMKNFTEEEFSLVEEITRSIMNKALGRHIHRVKREKSPIGAGK